MTRITEAQRNDVSLFLTSRGLSFQPLLDEMTDHICSEAEELISEGTSFEEALKQITSGLPDNHFITIQTDTMKSITSKLNFSRAFSFVAMGVLLFATAFKLLHLRGANELLLVGFSALAISLISGVIPGITARQEKGVARVVTMIGGTLTLMCGYAFKILHLPGADQLIIGGALLTTVALIVNTIYVYNNAFGHGNLMTYLHEKHSPAIEQFLLIMLTPLLIYKTIRMLTPERGSVADVVLIVVIYAAGLQLIALCWRAIEKRTAGSDNIPLLLIIASVCFMVPMMGMFVPFQVRLVCISLFSILCAVMAYRLDEEKSWKSFLLFFAPVVAIALSLAAAELIPYFTTFVAINMVIVAIMITAIFTSKARSVSRTYWILSLASFLIEFTPRLA